MIQELEKSFIGLGDVKKFKFNQIASNDKGYLYEVTIAQNVKYYEVILRKVVRICLDFYKKIYSETEFKEMYPKSSKFGLDAWTYKDKDVALQKLNEL